MKEEIRVLKREIQRRNRRAYWDHINTLFVKKDNEAPNSNSKRFWSYIKKQRKSNIGVPPLKENGILITDPTEKANVLNRQFDHAFSEGKVYTSESIKNKCSLPSTNCPTMPDLLISTDGVEKLLKNLDPSKAPGPDGISARVLKELAHEIAPSLSLVYRRSYDMGKVPSGWKVAHVTPVYKKGEHYKPSNYRPISLVSIPCKVMEHIVVSNTMRHLEDNKILAPNQHGFRAKHSCETQLIELTDEITRNLDNSTQTDIIILDFAKAFDKVNHSLLIHKLHSYGITGKSNRWIKDFLADRQQSVVVHGCKSSKIQVRSGVPQGSVLGPCLFLAYINDLPSRVKSNTRLFADDTAVDRKIKSPNDAKSLQADLDALAKWEEEWDMSFHPDKCTVMHISRSRTKIETDYYLHGQKLEIVKSAKYLGVTLQDDGEWEDHITNIVNAGNKTLGFIRRNLRVNSISTKSLAYIMMVRPKLDNASPVWDPYKQDQIAKIEKVQRRAARVVVNRHRNTSSVSDMLSTLGWDTLERRRKDARLTLLYKLQNGTASIHCPDLKPAISRSRRTTTAHSKQLDRHFCKNDYRLNAFFPRTIKDWNSLPEEAVQATCHDTFRAKVSRLV